MSAPSCPKARKLDCRALNQSSSSQCGWHDLGLGDFACPFSSKNSCFFELGLPQKALDSSLDMTDVGVFGPKSSENLKRIESCSSSHRPWLHLLTWTTKVTGRFMLWSCAILFTYIYIALHCITLPGDRFWVTRFRCIALHYSTLFCIRSHNCTWHNIYTKHECVCVCGVCVYVCMWCVCVCCGVCVCGVCVCVRVNIYKNTYTCTYTYTCISVRMYMCICIHVYMHTCIYVYMYKCIYVYTYICIFVYMYICIFVCK